MKKIKTGIVLFFLSFITKTWAQDTFEKKAHDIAVRIEKITIEEKQALKKEVDSVNTDLVEGKITKEEAEKKKQELAVVRAQNIEKRTAEEQAKLQELVQMKVDGKIASDGTELKKGGTVVIIGASKDSIGKSQTEIIIPSLKVYKGNDEKQFRQAKRTTSQFVFATGLNNLIENDKYADDKYSFIGSHFYEWGLTLNSRLMKDHNLLHAKYGLSLMYNNIRPLDNQFFVVNGSQTDLIENPIHLKESRFRNVNLVFPVHLEFDFSKPKIKNNQTYFRTHNSFRMGFGGYAGINLKSKQILKFDDNDLKAFQKTKGDYNVNNFIYGLSAYAGYRAASLYVKYDLNELFENNPISANNISLGIRFDFN